MRRAIVLACVLGCGGPGIPPAPPSSIPHYAPAPATAAAPSLPPEPPPPRLPEAIVRLQDGSRSQAYELVRSLTDEVGPRLSGSPGDRAAVEWALKKMAALGLANVRAEKVKVQHWQRGTESCEMLAPLRQPLSVVALGGSVATPARGVEADVLEVDSMDALQKMEPGSARGKIVFIHMPMRRARDGAGYGEVVLSRWSGARMAQKAGAVAVVIRSTGTDHDRLPHTGSKSKDDAEIPAGALSVPDAELLHRLLADKKPVRLRLTMTPQKLPETESANVIGEVLGREKPDEVVVLGAHLDSWDLGTGALDDGAGVGIVLEAGRAIAGVGKPRRTVRVVLFANEENGGAGNKGYAKAHEAEAAKHVAAMEADLGADRVYTTRYLGAPEGKERFLALADLLRGLGVTVDASDATGGADTAPLRELGVPIIDLRQDASRYFDYHHTANDTFDKVDKSNITQAAAVFATMAYAVADMEGDFGRIPQDKRKMKW